jgi:hypothetical protein
MGAQVMVWQLRGSPIGVFVHWSPESSSPLIPEIGVMSCEPLILRGRQEASVPELVFNCLLARLQFASVD